MVDQTLTVRLPGGSAPQRGLLDVGIHGHREKQLTLGEADHRLVTTQQLHGIDSSGHRHDVRGHACDPDTSPAISRQKTSACRPAPHSEARRTITLVRSDRARPRPTHKPHCARPPTYCVGRWGPPMAAIGSQTRPHQVPVRHVLASVGPARQRPLASMAGGRSGRAATSGQEPDSFGGGSNETQQCPGIEEARFVRVILAPP